jgi:polyhydroxybutyrate depolymerase
MPPRTAAAHACCVRKTGRDASATALARRIATAGALLCTVGGCATLREATPPAPPGPGSTTLRSLVVDGRSRSYWLHVPPGAARLPLPLLLVFHGHTGSATSVMNISGLNAEADRHGFLVAYPQGTGLLRSSALSWNAGTCCGYAARHHVDDIGFAVALAAALAREARADSTRVYAAGFSAGGMLALRLACERAATFAGVADVAGAMPDVACLPARPVAVLLIQGDVDDELRRDEVELRAPVPQPYAASLEGAAEFWGARNGCTGGWSLASTTTWTRVSVERCADGAGVLLYTVRGNPHAWPGGRRSWALAPEPASSVSASAIILDFFARRDPANDSRRGVVASSPGH